MTRWVFIVLIIVLPVFVIRAQEGSNTENEHPDRLIYMRHEYGEPEPLMMYDPQTGKRLMLLPDVSNRRIEISPCRWIAFTDAGEKNSDIYVIDLDAETNPPLNITQSPLTNEYPLGWNPDGRTLAFASVGSNTDGQLYLWDGTNTLNITPANFQGLIAEYGSLWSPDGRFFAFSSYEGGKNRQLYVWDGTNTLNITPNDLEGSVAAYFLSWSFDGRLAFITRYELSESIPRTVYLWDGQRTLRLNQNSMEDNISLRWNTDGRLAIFFAQQNRFSIAVWDGISMRNGSPDVETFERVAPEHTTYFSSPMWTDDGYLVFTGFARFSRHARIYRWDGETITDISQNFDAHNGDARWSDNGQWAFVTFFSPEQQIHIRDEHNQTLHIAQGQYIPAWSAHGWLAFCKPSRHGWNILFWNGNEVIPFVSGDVIWAQWQSGNSVVCSSG